MQNKTIKREGEDSNKIFDHRTLEKDYRHLKAILRPGLSVLDVGCGTGAITKDIAKAIGPSGKIIGIDNTDKFIQSGNVLYTDVSNMQLLHRDLFEFNTDEPFDLIVCARTLQWMSRVKEALKKMKDMLRKDGTISILDYDHTAIEWSPAPPESMILFYKSFLKWREDAGMNNRIAKDLPELLHEAGFEEIQCLNSDEQYKRSDADYEFSFSIWSKVAGLKQIVEEGYITEDARVKAIDEYDRWIKSDAVSMTIRLNEVRGISK